MRAFVLALALLGAPSVAAAQDWGDAKRLLAGLSGEWEGALGYRDYQSNELFELEMRTSISVLEDGRTMLSVSRYDEGNTPDVFIVSVSAFDGAGVYETAGFRDGRPMSLTREQVNLAEAPDATHWRMVFSERGMDDDRAADIRVTLTREGDHTLALKEVDYLDDPAVHFEFRNQTRLARVR